MPKLYTCMVSEQDIWLLISTLTRVINLDEHKMSLAQERVKRGRKTATNFDVLHERLADSERLRTALMRINGVLSGKTVNTDDRERVEDRS